MVVGERVVIRSKSCSDVNSRWSSRSSRKLVAYSGMVLCYTYCVTILASLAPVLSNCFIPAHVKSEDELVTPSS